MKDGQIIQLLGAFLTSAMGIVAQEMALTSWAIVQKAQPTQQGTPSEPTIFFEKLFDIPRGMPRIEYNYQTLPMSQTAVQIVESTFQLSALFKQDPTKGSVNTASDLLNAVRMCLMLPAMRADFEAQNLRILRITEVRNPKFENDSHMFEAHPSFDLVFTHADYRSITIPSTHDVSGEDFPI